MQYQPWSWEMSDSSPSITTQLNQLPSLTIYLYNPFPFASVTTFPFRTPFLSSLKLMLFIGFFNQIPQDSDQTPESLHVITEIHLLVSFFCSSLRSWNTVSLSWKPSFTWNRLYANLGGHFGVKLQQKDQHLSSYCDALAPISIRNI